MVGLSAVLALVGGAAVTGPRLLRWFAHAFPSQRCGGRGGRSRGCLAFVVRLHDLPLFARRLGRLWSRDRAFSCLLGHRSSRGSTIGAHSSGSSRWSILISISVGPLALFGSRGATGRADSSPRFSDLAAGAGRLAIAAACRTAGASTSSGW